MKKVLMTSGLLAAMALSAVAQAQYGYVGNQPGNTVVVFDPATPALLGAPASPITVGNGPSASVAVPSLNRIYVANRTSLTISVIDGSSLAVVNTIIIPQAGVIRGMCLSEDNSAIFLAGRNAALGMAGVWRISLPSETATWLDGILDANPAVDCEVVKAAAVGGSGTGPGKVYWTVTVGNYIGIKNLLTPVVPPTSLSIPAATADTPSGIERAPDSSFILVAVSTNVANDQIARIVPGVTDTLNFIDLGAFKGATFTDVAFEPAATGPFRTFACGVDVNSRIWDFSSDSAVAASVPLIVNISAAAGQSITYEPGGAKRLWVGDTSGTSNQLQPVDASGSPAVAGAVFTCGASGPAKVAFLPVPAAPTLDEACPKGQTDALGAKIRLRGSGFFSNSQIRFGVGAGTIPIPTTFVDANNLDGDVAGLGSTTFDVIVVNPDLQQARLNSFYRSVNAATAVPSPFLPIQLPPLNAGYEMKSFPEYATIDELKVAFQTQLGPYNPMFYRVFFWYTDHYEELNTLSTALDPCDLSGRAFYVLTRFGHPLSLAALDVTANTPSQLRVVPLMPGWNMFSQPWTNVNNQITWANVRVTANGDLTSQFSALGFATLSPLPYQRVNKAYVTVNLLTAGEGYWVHNYHTGPLYLVFDSTLVTKPGGVSLQMNALAPGDPGPPPPPSGVTSSSDGGSSGGCGLLGPELLGVVAVFQGLRRRRRLGA